MFELKTKDLGKYDIAVCGAGIAGVSAAVAAARNGSNVILIEKAGSLGGTLTESQMCLILDSKNKGGIVRSLYKFLDEHNMSCPRRGPRVDEDGNRLKGELLDVEGAKYYFDRLCEEAGVKVMFHSHAAALEMDGDRITSLLVATECGNYTLSADIYIDATGNGLIADLAGCEWECGDPFEGRPSPASMGLVTTGHPAEYNGTDSAEAKSKYAEMLLEYGIDISSQQASVVKLPSLNMWGMGINFEYDVMPDDIDSLTRAVTNGRREVFETIEKHKKIPGYEMLVTCSTNSHIGIREGRRVYGMYRLTDDDILEGKRFDDAICLVTFGVDVHKLKSDDTIECTRGYKAKPYHIPYRCLVARDCRNLMLAGRCISGDFYPHASYRVMGNMAATGEAGGYAASECVKAGILPRDFDGRKAKEYMISLGYEI